MYFNSLAFLCFLPLFLACFFATAGRARLWTCLVGSYVFYGWWDVRFLALIWFSTLVDYYVGKRLAVSREPPARKRLLVTSLVSNLGLLFVFKYFNFFRDSLQDACASLGYELSGPTLDIVVPVGISFYTFQTLSYSIDVYRGKLEPEPRLLNFAVFVSFFPQLVAGPIVRASDFLPQLSRDSPLRYRNVVAGGVQVISGFVKKVVIADSLAPYADVAFANPDSRTSATLAVAILFYAFQIYGDFAGYSDIAIGLARIMGFHFPENFRRPYFASSFSDFWQRWHISLSSWLRDYLYIPLGGNRLGARRTYINLMLTMLIGGLWHGAAWRFVAWGGLHGGYLVVQRLGGQALRVGEAEGGTPRHVRLMRGCLVFLAVCVAWVFFRADSFETASAILQRVFSVDSLQVGAVQSKIVAARGVLLIGGLVLAESLAGWVRLRPRCLVSPAFCACYFCTMGWLIAWLGNFGSSPFIYFQF